MVVGIGRRVFVAVVLAGVLAGTAAFAGNLPVKEYLTLRKKLMSKTPYESIRQNPSGSVGEVIETCGKINGACTNADGSVVVLTCTNGESMMLRAEILPQESSGTMVICLAKVGDECSGSLSDLRLVAYTYYADYVRWQQAEIQKQKTKLAQKQRARMLETRQAKSPMSRHTSAEDIVAAYRNAVKKFNPSLSLSQAELLARSVLEFSMQYKVDPRLVCAVILAESHFRPSATSRSGAQGLGQLMPTTAAGLGVNNSYDPVQNIYGSTRYIRSMLDRVVGKSEWNSLTFNDLALALTAYNAGPGAVKRHGGVPPYKETRNYVSKVTSIYRKLCGI